MVIREKTLLSAVGFDEFIKLAVDIKRRIIAIGCMFHVDCADELVADGSQYGDVWGANIYSADKKIEFDSLINIRPNENNRSLEIQNKDIRENVESVIKELLL